LKQRVLSTNLSQLKGAEKEASLNPDPGGPAMKTTSDSRISIRRFAEKRAATAAVVAGLLNALIIHLSLSGLSKVPIFALAAQNWKQSLIGALIPRAALISMLVTLVTVWATVRSHAAGKLRAPLEAGSPWVGKTLTIGLTRSIYATLFVLAIALVLRALLPTYTAVSTVWVKVFVTLFAAAIAYVMSYRAVLKTVL
jgi:hypothetical protein